MQKANSDVKNQNSKPPKKLLEQARDILRVKHYSLRTEKAYLNWMRRYIFFHNKRHPKEMGGKEIQDFLTHLAVQENVAASTQNQALNALLFLYRQVLEISLADANIQAVRAFKERNLPVVLTKQEVKKVLGRMKGTQQLMAKLLYGSGLRLMECLRLRVKDLDFSMKEICVRDGKGERSADPMRWNANSLMPIKTGSGNMCFPRNNSHLIP